MAKKTEKLLIFDGNAIVHRSFHALPPTMTTGQGEVVNAVYGFTSFLLKAVKEFQPTHAAVTFDLAGQTFRHERFQKYKAHRVKAPQELYDQLERVKEVVQALGLPIYEARGFEADDCIGTIVHEVSGRLPIVIVTGDLDTLQLIDEKTKVYTMSHGLSESLLYDAAAVRARFGFGPEAQIDYKALRGDPSDNIPGVQGIGEKTATALIKTFGGLEKLYQALTDKKPSDKLNTISPRIQELLRRHHEEALMSRDLATIRLDAPIKFNLSGARLGQLNQENARRLFDELEFKSLIARLADWPGVDKKNWAEEKFDRNRSKLRYELVNSETRFKKFLTELRRQHAVAVDTETDGLDELTAGLLGVSFCWQSGHGFFVPIRLIHHDKQLTHGRQSQMFAGGGEERDRRWLNALKPTLENFSVKKYGHNLKFDFKILRAHGVNLAGLNFDTMIASYLINPDNRQHNLDALTLTELGWEKISKNDLLGSGRQRLDFADVPLDKLTLYSCEDVDAVWRLVKPLTTKLRQEKLSKLFADLEMPLLPVLARMEEAGIAIDKNYFAALGKKLRIALERLENKIYHLSREPFNINSVQQLRHVLFDKLKIDTAGVTKTKTGLSTNAAVLEKLKDRHPVIKAILEYRELNKLDNTYVEALPKLINPLTGRLHTSFNQTVAATGRLSSTEPNLQNIPVKTDWGRQIRKGFRARAGYTLLSLDYSQIELRLAAHFSGDPAMIKAFHDNQDIHRATAAAINHVSQSEVTPAMRSAAKAINFGLLYGQGPRGLSETAGIPHDEAKHFIASYFQSFSHIRRYLDDSIHRARRDGFVQTILGRRRYLADINSHVTLLQKAAERVAINAPLQGTAADIIKLAMIKIDDLIADKFADRVKLLLQVHDELVFEVADSSLRSAAKDLRDIMEKVVRLKVPLVAEARIGHNWEDLKPL